MLSSIPQKIMNLSPWSLEVQKAWKLVDCFVDWIELEWIHKASWNKARIWCGIVFFTWGLAGVPQHLECWSKPNLIGTAFQPSALGGIWGFALLRLFCGEYGIRKCYAQINHCNICNTFGNSVHISYACMLNSCKYIRLKVRALPMI